MAMIIAFSASTSSGSSATAIVIAAITAYSRPVSQASQKPDSKCNRFFSPSIAAASQPPVGPSSSPAHRSAQATVHGSIATWPAQSGASRIARPQASCISIENADSSGVARQFVRVTHPFHPLFGRQLPCVGKRYNRYGERLLLQHDGATVWSVPPQWTDLVGPDPEIVIGRGRALLRTVDLMVKRLS